MPSGHVAFAIIAGVTFARLGDITWLRAVGWLYPPLMVAVIVATGNHLLVDAAASVLVVAVALVLARRRPMLWRAGWIRRRLLARRVGGLDVPT